MDFEPANYMLEQLGKTLNELVSRMDDLKDMVQWKDIEEHFHNLEKSIKKRSDELEEKEKAFVKKESKTHASLAEREAVIAAKEQASLDRIQEMKNAAVLTIMEAQHSYKATSQDPENKGIFVGWSDFSFSEKGNGGYETKDELSSQRKNYADGVSNLGAAEVAESLMVDSSILPSSSQIASHCESEASGHCNNLESLAHDQMMTCDVNGRFVGLRKGNAVIRYLPQHPTLPLLHSKIKVEYPDNDLNSPERNCIDSHVWRASENATEVPKNSSKVKGDLLRPQHVSTYEQNLPRCPTLSTFPIKVMVENCENDGDGTGGQVDRIPRLNTSEVLKSGVSLNSCTVPRHSRNTWACEFGDLPDGHSGKGTQSNGSIHSNEMITHDGNGDLVGCENVDLNKTQLPTISKFPIKVKVENSDDGLMRQYEGSISGHSDKGLNLDSAKVSRVGNGITVDSCMVTMCSQNANSCQCKGLSGDCSRPGTAANGNICLNQMTSCEAKRDFVRLGEVDMNNNNLYQFPALTSFPVKVKAEYFDNKLMGPHEEGSSDHVHGDPELNVNVCVSDLQKYPALPTSHVKVKVEGSDNELGRQCGESLSGFFGMDPRAAKVKTEMNGAVCTDDLDHILLKDRCNMLLSRHSVATVARVDRSVTLEGISPGEPAFLLEDGNQHIARNLKDDGHSVDAPLSMAGSHSDGIKKFKMMKNCSASLGSATLSTASNCKMIAMGDYDEFRLESYEDEIDHMILQDRFKLLISGKVSELNDCKSTLPSTGNHYSTVSENSKPKNRKNQRRRKKTATDSVETALEEDAPGLLQVLVDKGIVVDEIKLYGGIDGEDILDDSSNLDSFGELEDVISKVFSQSSSLLKCVSFRSTKGSKASYCLACLISLVEQTRYLQIQKWPIEWGWCRDLQSFIFVFARHNRIVLERPEYGYATYFFELVDSLPIDWQIKRLVTAMKLVSCSRNTIIENKPLLVGDDLTEGEARVLEEYGWTPNTGLGSMLNYCDRVVHSKKNEDTSEWRSKIGKFLKDGYNGGNIVLSKLPQKAIEYNGSRNQMVAGSTDIQSPEDTKFKISQVHKIVDYMDN